MCFAKSLILAFFKYFEKSKSNLTYEHNEYIYLFHFSYKFCLFTWLSAIDLIPLINLNSSDIIKFIPTSIIPIKWNDQPKFIGKLRENSFLNKFRLPSSKGRIIPQINWNFKDKATHNKMKIGNYSFLSTIFSTGLFV